MGVGWAVFRNYTEHAKEIKGDITSYPRFFLMPETSHLESDNEGNNIIYLPLLSRLGEWKIDNKKWY